LTPGDGADPRTFPAIWNATADDLEAGDYSRVPTGGSAGQVLVKDSGTDYDAVWQGLPNTVDPRAIVTGSGWTRNYTSHFSTPSTRTTSVNNSLRVLSFPLFAEQAFTHIGVRVSATTANAGALARLGIFTANPADFRNFDLVLDAGTVAVDTTGIKEIAITQTLKSGVYFLGAMTEDLTSGSVTFDAVGGSNPFMPAGENGGTIFRGAGTGGILPSSGPFPSTVTGLPSNASNPIYVFLRY
jgi:hypothetical protein